MPLLKFETKVVDGRPKIVFNTEKSDVPIKKFGYKSKVMKYPIRLNKTVSNNDERDKEEPESVKRVEVKKAKSNKNGNDKKESLFNFDSRNSKNTSAATKAHKDLSDDEIDDVMKQIVIENKDLLSEEQLVDLLAKVYLEAKHIQVEPKEPSKERRVVEKINLDEKFDDRSEKFDKLEKFDKFEKIDSFEKNKIPTNKEVPNTSRMSVRPPLTISEKKKLQWEIERQEQQKLGGYNPWGKPGCGAPYKTDEIQLNDTVKTSPSQVQHLDHEDNYRNLMNFDNENLLLTKEERRKQWKKELDEQVLAKQQHMLEENNESFRGANQNLMQSNASTRLSDNSNTYERGKGLASLNQTTNEELYMKRKKQMEQQEIIRQQIEEKDMQKRMERERKIKLDLEEEEKLRKQKETFESKINQETSRVKSKEDETERKFQQQKAQLEAAKRNADYEKRMNRLRKLEMGGHDTSRLRAELEAEYNGDKLLVERKYDLDDSYTSRQAKEELSPGIDSYFDYSPRLSNKLALTEDHSVQTDQNVNNIIRHSHALYDDDQERNNYAHGYYAPTEKSRRRYPNRSAEEMSTSRKNKERPPSQRRARTPSEQPQREFGRKAVTKIVKKPEPVQTRRPWGTKKVTKKYVPQSKRDPFYADNKNNRECKRAERVDRILRQVRANAPHIPQNDGSLSQRHKMHCDVPRATEQTLQQIPDNDKENMNVQRGTFEIRKPINEHEDHSNLPSVRSTVYQKPTDTRRSKNSEYGKPVNESEESWFYDGGEHKIVRTNDFLNPAVADDEIQISRENTGRERARHSYYRSMNPAHYGSAPQKNQHETFYKPSGYPTERQNTILQQLSSIREGLLMKQREIETSLTFDD